MAYTQTILQCDTGGSSHYKWRKQEVVLGSISPTFYEQLLRQNPCAKKVQTYNVSTKKLLKTLSYEKAARKMLMKLTPDW